MKNNELPVSKDKNDKEERLGMVYILTDVGEKTGQIFDLQTLVNDKSSLLSKNVESIKKETEEMIERLGSEDGTEEIIKSLELGLTNMDSLSPIE